ncbi:MAG: O-antigen ligase family protein [Pseudomonadota bacterium]
MSQSHFDFQDDPLLVRPARRQKGRRRDHAQYGAATFVALSAVLAAIPNGLNRPALWLVFGVLVAVSLMALILLGRRSDRKELAFKGLPLRLMGVAAIVPVWAVLQAIPIFGPTLSSGSGTISLVPDASLIAALRFVIYIQFFYLAVVAGVSTDRSLRIVWFIFLGIVGHAVWSLLALNLLGDINLWQTKTAYLGVATGTYVNRNAFAVFLAMGSCLGLALVAKPASQRDRIRPITDRALTFAVGLAALMLIWLALVETQSRLGIASAAIGSVITFAVLRFGEFGLAAKPLAIGLGLGLALLSAIGMVAAPELVERSLFIGEDALNRATAYRFTLELISQRPFIGYGFDNFRPAFEAVHRPPLSGDFYWDRTHSTYLSNWTELGVLVGSVPVLLGLMICHALARAAFIPSKARPLYAAALGCLGVAGLHSIADFGFEIPANTILLIAITGLALARVRSNERGA